VLLPDVFNGTGHPDYTLNGLSLIGLDLTHQYAFFARISGANDGPDSFFIVPQQLAETPLPAAAWLVIGGLGVLGMAAGRRRKQRTAWEKRRHSGATRYPCAGVIP
jgi:hypothetical protein